jgi:hypothetical protein
VNLTVRDTRWKYVANWKPRDFDELYDTQADPGELHNLAADPTHARRFAEMRDRAARWLRDAGHPYAANITRAIATPAPEPLDARPVVTHFRHVGGNRFEFGYEWRIASGPKLAERYWSFCQFLKGRDIAFRLVRWPDKATPDWRPGDVVPIAPAVIEVPPKSSGAHDVVIGLWEPEKKTWPPMVGAFNNSHTVGRLTIERAGADIKSIRFQPAE